MLAVGLAAIAAAFLVRVHVMPTLPPSAVTETAAEASPEVAALLHEADEVGRRMLAEFPQSLDALNVMAMLHARFGDQDDAIAYWERCLEKDPHFARAHFHIGLIAHERGDNAEASKHFARATEIDNALSNYPVHWAKSLTNEGKLEEAAEVLRADLARHPDSVASLTILGDTYLQLKEEAQAKACYERVVELAPEVTSAHYGLGMACSKLGEVDAAKAHLARFKELKKEDEQAHREELKTEELGLVRARKSVAEILTTAAKGYVFRGDTERAGTLLRRARQLSPSLSEASRVLAWLYERQGRVEEALATLSEFVERVDDDAAAYLRLAKLQAQVGDLEGAEESFRRLTRLVPNEASAYAMLGEFQLHVREDAKEARTAAAKAVELDPTAAPHYFLLAMACWESGDSEAAAEAVDQAIALAPDNDEYRRLRATISGRQGAH
ncbi:MAG: tetratricopeptide repeat protein [Planctomycetota bacterium]